MDRTFRKRLRRALDALTDPSSYRVMRALLFGRMLDAGDLPAARPVAREMPVRDAGDAEIPPIVFQTWKSRAHIPANYHYWRQTIVALCPRYQVILWDDSDNRAFLAGRFPWFMTFYDQYPREIFRADIVRLFFLFAFGGIYIDMDTECLTSLDGLRAEGDVVLGRMGRDEGFEHSIPNAIMASKPRQAFWLVAIALAIRELKAAVAAGTLAQSGPERLTGPILIKNAHDLFLTLSERDVAALVAADLPEVADEVFTGGSIKLLDRRAFYPLCWTNFIHRRLKNKMDRSRLVPDRQTALKMFPGSYVATYWSHSWG